MHLARHLVLGILLVLACATPAWSANGQLVVDNDTDFFIPGPGATDRNYTMGVRFNLFHDAAQAPGWAGFVPGFKNAEHLRMATSIGQEIYTPDAISRSAAIADDRPYAGWLYTGRVIVSEQERIARSFELDLGVVGPASKADRLQTWWHRETGVRLPRGWRNQVANEPGVLMRWEERRRPWGYQRHVDFVPHAGLAVGNVLTQANAGGTLRIGMALPDDFGPWRNAPPPTTAGGRRFSLYAFARAEGRVVGHNIMLDGNTFAPNHRVSRLPLVGESELGAGLGWGRFGVRYVFSYTTQEFRERTDAHRYGSVVFQF